MRKRPKNIPDEERDIRDPERSRERTMNRAIRLLAAKPRSVAELSERLLEKPWTKIEIVESVIEKLIEYKYLDDKQYARDLALSKLRQRPQGKRKLQHSLSQKKLSQEDVEQAVNLAFKKLPEDNLIDLAIEKRLRQKGRPETREEMKKFFDHLLRQGFSYDLIRTKLAEIPKAHAVHENEAS